MRATRESDGTSSSSSFGGFMSASTLIDQLAALQNLDLRVDLALRDLVRAHERRSLVSGRHLGPIRGEQDLAGGAVDGREDEDAGHRDQDDAEVDPDDQLPAAEDAVDGFPGEREDCLFLR